MSDGLNYIIIVLVLVVLALSVVILTKVSNKKEPYCGGVGNSDAGTAGFRFPPGKGPVIQLNTVPVSGCLDVYKEGVQQCTSYCQSTPNRDQCLRNCVGTLTQGFVENK